MPIFQPILEQRNAPTMVRPGVQDNSTASLISSFGEQAIDLYTGYQEAKLEKGIKTDVESYFNSQQQYQEDEQAGIEAMGIRTGIDEYWNQFDANIDDANTLEKSYQAKINRYKTAMEQGSMSISELEARILSTTREAINRNPGLTDILLKRADRTLELSGASSYIKAAKSEAIDKQAAQQQFINSSMVDARGKGIDPLADPNWYQKLIRINQDEAVLKLEQETLKSGQIQDEKLASTWIGENQTRTIPAVYTSLSSTLTNLLAQKDVNGQKIPWETARLQMKDLVINAREEFFTDVNTIRTKTGVPFITVPGIKDYVDSKLKAFDEIEKSFDGFGSGDEAKRWLSNQRDLKESQQKLAVMGVVNVPAIDSINKLFTAVPALQNRLQYQKDANGKPLLDSYLVAASNMASVSFNPNLTNSGMDGKPIGINVLDTSLEAGNTGLDVSKELESNITTIYKGLSDPTITKDRNILNFATHAIASLASSKNQEAIKQLSPDGRRTATNLIEEYLGQVKTQSTLRIQELEGRGIKLQWDLLPDGTWNLEYAQGSAKDDKALSEMNKVFAGHLNNAQKAFSYVFGKSDWRQTSRDFFIPRYMGEVDTSVAKSLKDMSKGSAETPSQLSSEQLKSIGIDMPTSDWQIPPEVQATRDKTRIRVLREEINDYSKQLEKETDPVKRKMAKDNIKAVMKELEILEKGK